MLPITPHIAIPLDEIDMQAIRAQGAGGQNVNKVSSAIHLRFDIRASSLPEEAKQSLLQHADQRISSDAVIVIKARRHRSREQNREDALARLQGLVRDALAVRKPRRPTRVSKAARQRRLEAKGKRSRIKRLRGKVGE